MLCQFLFIHYNYIHDWWINMPLYNEVGITKTELNQIRIALDYAAVNDGSLSAASIESLENISGLFVDIRQQLVNYEAANAVTVDPYVVLRANATAF